MKVRRHLRSDETLYRMDEYQDNEHLELFLGGCKGIALVQRGKKDKHICYVHLTEDDEAWFPSGNSGTSSFWLPEEIEVLKAVQEWLKKNAEPDMYEGNQFGWKFKN